MLREGREGGGRKEKVRGRERERGNFGDWIHFMGMWCQRTSNILLK